MFKSEIATVFNGRCFLSYLLVIRVVCKINIVHIIVRLEEREHMTLITRDLSKAPDCMYFVMSIIAII